MLRKGLGLFASGFSDGFSAEYQRLTALVVAESAQGIPAHAVIDDDEVDDGLILEIIERVHERFLDRLNALDTALVGLMAAVLAIAAIAIDKYADLSASIPYFAASLFVCGLGWFCGNAIWPALEPVDPAHFMAGVTEKGAEALPELASQILSAYKERQWLRLAKVIAVAVGISLLIVGVISAIQAEGAILSV